MKPHGPANGKSNGKLHGHQWPSFGREGVASSEVKPVRFVVCGGDGTVTWILNQINEIFGHFANFEVHGDAYIQGAAIIPLGTGNDL